MSEGRWFELNPLPELFGLAAAGRALLPNVPVTPAAVLKTVTEQLVGRRLTTKVDGHDVGLTLTGLDYQPTASVWPPPAGSATSASSWRTSTGRKPR